MSRGYLRVYSQIQQSRGHLQERPGQWVRGQRCSPTHLDWWGTLRYCPNELETIKHTLSLVTWISLIILANCGPIFSTRGLSYRVKQTKNIKFRALHRFYITIQNYILFVCFFNIAQSCLIRRTVPSNSWLQAWTNDYSHACVHRKTICHTGAPPLHICKRWRTSNQQNCDSRTNTHEWLVEAEQ